MEKILTLVITAVVGMPVIAAFIAVGSIIRGWAIHLLWAWFAVPIFALPALSIGQAIGISMLVGLFSINTAKSDDDIVMIAYFISPFVTVAIAFVVKLIVM